MIHQEQKCNELDLFFSSSEFEFLAQLHHIWQDPLEVYPVFGNDFESAILFFTSNVEKSTHFSFYLT